MSHRPLQTYDAAVPRLRPLQTHDATVPCLRPLQTVDAAVPAGAVRCCACGRSSVACAASHAGLCGAALSTEYSTEKRESATPAHQSSQANARASSFPHCLQPPCCLTQPRTCNSTRAVEAAGAAEAGPSRRLAQSTYDTWRPGYTICLTPSARSEFNDNTGRCAGCSRVLGSKRGGPSGRRRQPSTAKQAGRPLARLAAAERVPAAVFAAEFTICFKRNALTTG